MKIKKVAHIVRRFSKKEWGGTENSVRAIAQELEKKNILSPIFTTSMMESPGEEYFDQVLVKRFSYSLPWFNLSEKEKQELIKKGGSPLSLSLFFSLLFEKDLSLIHTHASHRLGGIARCVARLRNIPYVVSLHSGHFTLPESQKKGMESYFSHHYEWGKCFGFLFGARKTLLDADGIIAVGKDEFEMCERNFPHKKVFYLPNGIHPHLFEPKQEVQKEKIILCVSRIDPQKNQALLIRAFSEFSKEYKDHSLYIVGPISETNYFHKLEALIQTMHLQEKVHIIPGVQPESVELLSLFQKADFFVLPSLHEPFGIVVLEAWASKLPVIASKVGGLVGFTEHERTVLHFQTEEELVFQMKRLAKDSATKESLALHGSKEVQKYSWSTIVDQLLSHYEEL